MSFLRQLGRRFMAFMSGRNGFDQLALATLITSLLLQLIGSFMGSILLFLLSLALYAWSLFRIFSRKSYKREEENRKFVMGWQTLKTKARQLFLRLKNSRQYKYFKCPQCHTLLRVNRGEGPKDVCCPKCQMRFTIKS